MRLGMGCGRCEGSGGAVRGIAEGSPCVGDAACCCAWCLRGHALVLVPMSPTPRATTRHRATASSMWQALCMRVFESHVAELGGRSWKQTPGASGGTC